MVSGYSLVGHHIKTLSMIFEDYERDHLKEMIYLQEGEEILAAEIKVIKDESKDNIQEVREVNPARIYVGYDLPFEDDPR